MLTNGKPQVVLLPLYLVKLLGYPGQVRLSAKECEAIASVHLGGASALYRHADGNTPKYVCHRSTIDSLYRKGIFDRDGLTDLGKHIAESICAPTE